MLKNVLKVFLKLCFKAKFSSYLKISSEALSKNIVSFKLKTSDVYEFKI